MEQKPSLLQELQNTLVTGVLSLLGIVGLGWKIRSTQSANGWLELALGILLVVFLACAVTCLTHLLFTRIFPPKTLDRQIPRE